MMNEIESKDGVTDEELKHLNGDMDLKEFRLDTSLPKRFTTEILKMTDIDTESYDDVDKDYHPLEPALHTRLGYFWRKWLIEFETGEKVLFHDLGNCFWGVVKRISEDEMEQLADIVERLYEESQKTDLSVKEFVGLFSQSNASENKERFRAISSELDMDIEEFEEMVEFLNLEDEETL